MAPRRTNERGAALLVVMVAVAVLTILAVQLAYDTRVSLQIAANARDDLRATYLAKSGVTLSRLVLSFQKQIDVVPGIHLQLWRLVPVGSTLASGLFGGGAAPEAAPGKPAAPATGGEAPAAAPARPGGVDGFEAKTEDEGLKVYAQLDGSSAPLLAAEMQGIYQLVCDPRWDALFDREDENGMRVSRKDLLGYLRDWVDTDSQGSAAKGSFPPAGCTMLGPLELEDGFQDENSAYERGPDRYRAKNARMDSLDELYMIAGVGDAFMAAFGDALTVYLKPDGKRSVSHVDKESLLRDARIVADPNDPVSQARLLDPKFADELQEVVVRNTFGGKVAMTSKDLGTFVGSLGVKLNPLVQLDPKNPNSPFTESPYAFGIRAQGKAGAVSKTLDVVVRFDDAQLAAGPTPGRLVHWHEE